MLIMQCPLYRLTFDVMASKVLHVRAEEDDDVDPRSDMHTAVLNPTLAETASDSRATLRQRFAQLQDPSATLEILPSYVPSCPAPVEAVCTRPKFGRGHDGRDDRFVVRADVFAAGGER
jgi:hypothetical protein